MARAPRRAGRPTPTILLRFMKQKLLVKILLAATGLACGLSVQAGNITVKGSDTLVILAQKWAEVYMSKNPATKIQVTGGGSGVGFAALQNRTTDLADASRKIDRASLAVSDRDVHPPAGGSGYR